MICAVVKSVNCFQKKAIRDVSQDLTYSSESSMVHVE